MPPWARDPVGDGRGDVAAVERLGAVAAEPVEGVGELGVDDDVALAQEPAAGGPERGRLGRAGQEAVEDPQDVGLLDVERHAAAGEVGGRGDERGE